MSTQRGRGSPRRLLTQKLTRLKIRWKSHWTTRKLWA